MCVKSPVCYHGNREQERWSGPSCFRLNTRREQTCRDEFHHAAASSCAILSLPPTCKNNDLIGASLVFAPAAFPAKQKGNAGCDIT